MTANAIPEGYHSVTPYLIVAGAREALAFYERAFGARTRFILDGPGESVMHAEFEIGDSVIMITDEFAEMGFLGPLARGGATSSHLIYCDDADALYARAVEAGATAQRPVEDQFWGDRMGHVVDPWGHAWSIATHVEEVSPEDLERRAAEARRQMEAGDDHCG